MNTPDASPTYPRPLVTTKRQSVELLPPHELDLHSVCERVAYCGRIAYRKEATNTSPEDFVLHKLIKPNHGSVLEHAYLHLSIPLFPYVTEMEYDRLFNNYFTITRKGSFSESKIIVSANVRAWRDWIRSFTLELCCSALFEEYPLLFEMYDKSFASDPDITVIRDWRELPISHLPYTYIIGTDRGISHEIVRHRILSPTQESTRYVAYDSSLTIIEDPTLPEDCRRDREEHAYQCLRRYHEARAVWNETKEMARDYLPHNLYTLLAVTGTRHAWSTFTALRSSPTAHPRIRAISDQIKGELII